MPNPRDIFLQQFKPMLDNKQDAYPPFRAVLTADNGLTTTGSVWKDENARLVWFRAWGSGSPAWALCDVLEPVLGLGVIIKFNPDINQYEVQRDDPLMRSPSSDRTSYRAITDQDLLKGGRFQLWLDPTMFIPISIYPTGADTVNVVSGDYIFQGERKTFAGAVNQDILASRPAAGFHRFVGFYLDSANTLHTIDGNTVATGTDALEPSWPAGVFRIGVVDIDNATDISIDNIDNRKVIYTEDDETGALNVWPRADEVNINYTPYAAWSLAIDALGDSEQAIIGEGTFLSDDERIETESFVKGSGIDVSILSTTTKDRALTLAKSPIILEDFTLSNTYSAVIYGDYWAAYITGDALIDAFRVKFITTGTGANINYGTYINSGGYHRFADCIWDARNGSANYAFYMDAVAGLYSGTIVDLYMPDITGNVHNEDGILTVYGGSIDGDVYAGNGATINLYNLPLITGSVTNHAGGSIVGYYIDAAGIIHPAIGGGAWPGPGQIFLWDVSTDQTIEYATIAAANTAADDGDVIYLGAGTYTLGAQLNITKQIEIAGPPCEAGTNPLVTIQGAVAGGLVKFTDITSFPFPAMVNIYVENIVASGAGHAVVIDNSVVTLFYCSCYAESGDGVADAVRVENDGVGRVNIIGGLYWASPATTGYAVNLASFAIGDFYALIYAPAYLGCDNGTDINVVANGEVYLYRPVLEDVSLNGAGSYFGECIDPNGVTRYVADTTPADDDVPIWDAATARWVPGPQAAGGGNAWPLDDELIHQDGTTYATVALLLAAIGASEIGYIGNITATCDNQTLSSANGQLRGASSWLLSQLFSNAAIRVLSITGANAQIEDLFLYNDQGNAAEATALYVAVAGAYVRRCYLRADSDTPGTGYAARIPTGAYAAAFYDTTFKTGSSDYCLFVGTDAVAYVYGGEFWTGIIKVDTGADLYLYGPRFKDSVTIVNNGDIRGWYWDASDPVDKMVFIGDTALCDLNGNADALVLDADGDTTISAPTDDQIDFEASGADRMTLTAAGLALASGARVNDIVTTVDDPGDDTTLCTEQAIREALDAISGGSLVLISETILTGSVASTTFSSIPATYRHLLLFAEARTSRAAENDDMNIQFNGDSGNNYDRIVARFGSAGLSTFITRATSSIQGASQAEGDNSRANNFAPSLSVIFSYARTDREKWLRNLGTALMGDVSADTDVYEYLNAGRWRSTSAITSITIAGNVGNLVSGCVFQLYGVL